jgi:DNA-binding HxlR family transcriptional regulator
MTRQTPASRPCPTAFPKGGRATTGKTSFNERCSIARSLDVLGEKWTLLVVRDVRLGVNRFSDLKGRLGIASDILADRLAKLVSLGVLERAPYRAPGTRIRDEYVLTTAGLELTTMLAALTEWGDRHLPTQFGPSLQIVEASTSRQLHVGFLDERGNQVALEAVDLTPGRGALSTTPYPTPTRH